MEENNTEQTTTRKSVQNSHELSPGYAEKATTSPSLRKYSNFHIYAIFLRFNNYTEFLIQKSLNRS